ncbi:MAG: TIGR04255 family protein [Intestinimonas sp.]|jgi:uncharacterized protein (TIGR04255 family)|nr:TIGR04255 family protein [Intestinimonas sp.]
MLFADYDRYTYTTSPLIEVICQLRFPAILSIGSHEPSDFQEAIRDEFPRYAVRNERPAPQVKPGPDGPTLERQPPVSNYNFISADGCWKINLTSGFIALSTLRYTRWEEFAQRLDRPLAQFIQAYHPAFFERIGLRYVNAVSRRALGLENVSWADLIQPAYLGVLAEPDVDRTAVTRSSIDSEFRMADDCRMKLHAGPGLLNGGKQDTEVKFILDSDGSARGNISADKVPETLETLHHHAVCLFRGAVTSQLHTAMGPTPI